MLENIYAVTEMILPPANIVAICESDFGHLFRDMGYNFLHPFPCGNDFHSFLAHHLSLSPGEVEPVESPAYWDCFVCDRDPPSQGFETLIAHLSSEEHQEEMALELLALESQLTVAPLPSTVAPLDPPSTVAPLDPPPFMVNGREYVPIQIPSGSPEMDMEDVSVFRAVSHGPPPFMPLPEIDKEAVTSVFWDISECPVPCGFDARLAGPHIKRYLKNEGYAGPLTITAVGIRLTHVLEGSREMMSLMYRSINSNPPPANIMVIANPNFVRRRISAVKRVNGFAPNHASQGFEDFTTHLASRAHERKMLDCVPRNVRLSKKQPLNASYHRQRATVRMRVRRRRVDWAMVLFFSKGISYGE
ncbi:unnamed protein product [Arabis nemorensis]|uniref:NYN domain-containing protein n=1 Tax=Arabis nemorensis TaxID=586526 RepID=A0A565BYT6_9BRAS|nr:unnamed protein product [Arabis nemorensis]